MDKSDMSNLCDFKYEEHWIKANRDRTMPQEDWMKWYMNNCGKCIYMCEICMYGEK